jgi:hypothetical protein
LLHGYPARLPGLDLAIRSRMFIRHVWRPQSAATGTVRNVASWLRLADELEPAEALL